MEDINEKLNNLKNDNNNLHFFYNNRIEKLNKEVEYWKNCFNIKTETFEIAKQSIELLELRCEFYKKRIKELENKLGSAVCNAESM